MSWLASVRLLPIARELGVNEPEIVRAIDLGGVQGLKHGDLFLLSDGFGDVRPDSRGLGLYTGDTRTTELVADLVEPAKAAALYKLDEGQRALGMATEWVRTKVVMTPAPVPDTRSL